MKRLLITAGIAAFALAGCSKSAGDAQGETSADYAQRAGVGAATSGVPTVAEVNAQPVVAPSGTAQLTPLAADALKALGSIKGDCSFVYQGRSLFVAGTQDAGDRVSNGVLVIDGRQVVLPGASAGGPQVVESGPTLSGGGYTVAVNRAEGAPQAVAGRNEWAADLVVTGPGGETKFSPGTWNCTP
jgi:hypothetical protein